ncbi:MAG: prolipoprotein diacylglyceryl transferase [Acidobacteria bacterium]|nr:prolipoprotein diacylglyceryl transferase [Acidobacteriota bacterium]
MFPKLISFGDFFLPTYGVLVALAFFLALRITVREGERRGIARDLMTNLAIYCVLAGLLGAKLFLILFDLPEYLNGSRPLFSMATLQAAGVFQGGLILAVLVGVWYIRKHRIPLWPAMDATAPGIALGHAIGRLGCLAAGCCWGIACERPWAIRFHNPDAEALTGVPLDIPLHPTQIYESLAEFGIFLFLLWRMRRPHRDGEILGLYLVISSGFRFWIEFYRFHAQALPFDGPWSLTQWISVGLFACGAWILYGRRQKVPVAA